MLRITTILILLVTWTGLPSYSSAEDSYTLARRRAVAEGKPLIVWVGGNFCERCVQDSKDEFVHCFVRDGWYGQQGPATIVAAPHQGELYQVGVVTRWTVGSHDWGHIPSARRIVAEWRRRAAQGNLVTIPLLQLSGGSWGWPADRRSLPADDRQPTPARSVPVRRGGNC